MNLQLWRNLQINPESDSEIIKTLLNFLWQFINFIES